MQSKWQNSREALLRHGHDEEPPVEVLIPGALQSYTLQSRVEAFGHTLDALFDDLERRYPGLRFRVVDEQNLLRPNMRIFVNGVSVRELQHALQPGDFVAVVLALSGG